MFTGIIQETGGVISVAGQDSNLVIDIEARNTSKKLKIGDSVAINGACQTVIFNGRDNFRVQAVAETISRTNLGKLKGGSAVNLELPMALGDLLHGHLVQGHIDCIGKIIEIRPLDGSFLFGISYPAEFYKLLVEKGSVAVDGVSLTVVKVSESSFQISMIPHTIEKTIFRNRKPGDIVNLEFDMIAKYIQKMVSPNERGITTQFLKEHGF